MESMESMIDDLVKSRLSRASGKPGSANILKRLDSHFHGNDGKIGLRTFYETINDWGYEEKFSSLWKREAGRDF